MSRSACVHHPGVPLHGELLNSSRQASRVEHGGGPLEGGVGLRWGTKDPLTAAPLSTAAAAQHPL
jgi:hypothetical protein